MKPGNKLILTLISLFLFSKFSIADDKITTSPLINIEKIKPSFESLEEENENSSLNKDLKTKKKRNNPRVITSHINWVRQNNC